MRRILLIAAILLPVTSAMAAVPLVRIAADVNAVQFDLDGIAHKTVTISYIADVNVRAFALDINVDGGMNIGDRAPTGFLRGESIAPPNGTKGYGIFPGRFRDFINPSVPDWDDENYMPVTPWNSPGAENTGLGWTKIVVELGTLYSGDANRPALSGNLFTFDVNSEGLKDCNLTVAVNALRGAIVGSDAAEITDTNLPFTKKVVFQQGCVVPNVLTMSQAAATAAITGADLVVGTVRYVDGIPKDVVVWQNPAGLTEVECQTAVDINVTGPCVKTTSAFYNWWRGGAFVKNKYPTFQNAPWSEPNCFCFPHQCRGDMDGKTPSSTNRIWVTSPDIAMLRSSLNKQYTNTATNGFPQVKGICADFDHAPVSSTTMIPVSLADTSSLRSHLNKNDNPANSSVKCCDEDKDCDVSDNDPNYNFWTNSLNPPGL